MRRLLYILLVLTFCALPSMGYYGVDIDPSNAKTFKHSRIVPKNAVIFEMMQPDGVKRIFQRDFDDESILLGDNPWIGEEQNNRITIMTNPEFKKGQTGFLFDKGWLRLMLLNGKQYRINKIPFNVSTNASLVNSAFVNPIMPSYTSKFPTG
jgi:hypothetical protein